MQYTIILTDKELDTIARLLQEGPYRIVKPLLDNIGGQVDLQNTQNQPKLVEENN